MKKIFRKIALACLIAVSGMSVTSCNDNLDQTPIDSYTAYNFWTKTSQFTGNVSAIANMFRSNYATNILFYAGELRAGTLTLNTIDGSGILNSDVIQNLFDSTTRYQFSNMGNYYGFVTVCNDLIYNCDNASEDLLDSTTRDGLKAMAYGWRAFAFFQMYRMYGGVVLRTTPDVLLGNYDPTSLYQARATCEETLTQIKSDIAESLKLFNSSGYVYSSSKEDYYWNKCATEMLAGEVYLWSGKVSTGNHTATPADVTTAKQYFLNVLNNYNKSLVSNYFDIWQTAHSSESIYSMLYSSEGDAVYFSYPAYYFLWARTTGAGYHNYWSTHDKTGWGHNGETTANRFGCWYDTETQTSSLVDIWNECSFGPMRYMYKNALYFQFDEKDSRRDMWYPCWGVTSAESSLEYLDNFDPKTRTTTDDGLQGAYVCKYRPGFVSSSTYYTFNHDVPIYRLSEVYLYLAECYNYEGNNTEVQNYINAIRKRAYGDNWDENTYGYKAGSFADNESAILHEKDKEFIMEGTRFFDLVRLAVDKSGDRLSSLVFQPQGCVGYGLDVANSPWMIENDGKPCATNTPLLTSDQAYKVLWPIDDTLMNSDTEIKQNPGYTDDTEKIQYN